MNQDGESELGLTNFFCPYFIIYLLEKEHQSLKETMSTPELHYGRKE